MTCARDSLDHYHLTGVYPAVTDHAIDPASSIVPKADFIEQVDLLS